MQAQSALVIWINLARESLSNEERRCYILNMFFIFRASEGKVDFLHLSLDLTNTLEIMTLGSIELWGFGRMRAL